MLRYVSVVNVGYSMLLLHVEGHFWYVAACLDCSMSYTWIKKSNLIVLKLNYDEINWNKQFVIYAQMH